MIFEEPFAKKLIVHKSLFIIFGSALSAALAFSAALVGSSSAWSWLLLAALPAAGLLVLVIAKIVGFARSLDVFSPCVAFPLVYVAWFAIGSIDFIQLPSEISFGAFDPIPLHVMLYAALGLAAYTVGVRLAPGKAKITEAISEVASADAGAGVDVEDRWRNFPWRQDRFVMAIAGLGALMFASYLWLIAAMGAIPALSADAGEIRLRILRAGPAEAVLFTCAWTLIPLLMMYVWHRSPVPKARLLCFAGVTASALLLLSLGGRSYLFVPLLTTLICRHYAKRRFAMRKLAAVSLALFCGMSLFGYVRDTALNNGDFGEDHLGIPGSVAPFVYAYLYVRYPVATFRDVTEIIPRKVPYSYGALSFGPLATLLPGHHEQSDMFFKNILGNDFIGAGQPATLLGPLYADAGWPGIVLGLFLAGTIVSRAYVWMLERPTAIRVLLYAWLMQTLLFSLFANLFPYITTLWIPLFWLALDRFLRKPNADAMFASLTEKHA